MSPGHQAAVYNQRNSRNFLSLDRNLHSMGKTLKQGLKHTEYFQVDSQYSNHDISPS